MNKFTLFDNGPVLPLLYTNPYWFSAWLVHNTQEHVLLGFKRGGTEYSLGILRYSLFTGRLNLKKIQYSQFHIIQQFDEPIEMLARCLLKFPIIREVVYWEDADRNKKVMYLS